MKELPGVLVSTLVVKSVEAVAGVVLVIVLEEASSDNMGNKESSEGVLSSREGTSLTKFPIAEEERVVFLLYHKNILTRAITHMPTVTNRAKMSLGESVKG